MRHSGMRTARQGARLRANGPAIARKWNRDCTHMEARLRANGRLGQQGKLILGPNWMRGRCSTAPRTIWMPPSSRQYRARLAAASDTLE
jgi:hypothetical protein